MRAALVSTQVAVALVLLVGAGLLVRSFLLLLDVNPGFDAQQCGRPSPRRCRPRRDAGAARRRCTGRIRDKLMAVPGVVNVAAVSRLPMMGQNLGSWAFVEGKSVPGSRASTWSIAWPRRATSPRWEFPCARAATSTNTTTPMPAAVLLINETMARKFWPGENAVGKRLKLGSTPERAPWITVVGVVGDVRHFGMDIEPRAEVYRPYAVNPLGAPILVIRTSIGCGGRSRAR